MPNATVQQETVAGVPRVRFTTDARPGTEEEDQLQEIQLELSDGVDSLGAQPTVAHLTLHEVATVDGPSHSVISLWVPAEQQPLAVERLQSAGFTIL
jgi:hypothetical protein